jgi:hypothetical protein
MAAATALHSTPFESAPSSTSNELWSVQTGQLLVEHVQQPAPSLLLDVLGQYFCTHPINSFAKNMLKAYLGSSQTAASSGSIDGQMWWVLWPLKMSDLLILSIYAQQNYTSLVKIPVGTWQEGGCWNGENPGDSRGELTAFLDFSCLHLHLHCRILSLEKSRISR